MVTITKINPSPEELNNLLAHYHNGELEKASMLAESITKKFPAHILSWQILGAVFSQTGRKSEAVVANQRAVKLDPNNPQVHYNLGITLQELARFDDAETSYKKALALKSDFIQAHSNLGNVLKELGRLDEAEASYRQTITLKPDYNQAHYNLGNLLKELGRLDEAEAFYRQAITLNPDYAQAQNNLGIILQELGRFDEAEACYRQAITLKPDYAQAHRHLVSVKKFDKQDEHFLHMQELSFDYNYPEEERCHLTFALAKASEDLGELEKSFKYYSEGNALRKKLLNYDINQDIELFKQLKNYYPEIKKKSLESKNLSNKLTPIFIVGMPRSGTTLVEQIISSHSQVSGAGELLSAIIFGDSIARGLSELDSNTLLNFRESYLRILQATSNGSARVTDKMPQNFLYLGLLAAAFPDAKIVHVRRNAAAVCWGNYKQFFGSNTIGYPYNLNDILNYYALYLNIIEFWEAQLPNRIYNFDYELLTTNQEEETKNLIRYLGLDWENECLSPQKNKRSIATLSNKQIRNKIYQGSSQQWKKFKPFLNGALDHLDD